MEDIRKITKEKIRDAEFVYTDKSEEVMLAMIIKFRFRAEILLPDFIVNNESLVFTKKKLMKTPMYSIGKFESKKGEKFDMQYLWFFKFNTKKVHDFLSQYLHAVSVNVSAEDQDALRKFTKLINENFKEVQQ